MNDAKRYQLLLEYQNGFGIQYPKPGNDEVPICIINEMFDKNNEFVKIDFDVVKNEIKNEVKTSSLQWSRYCGKHFFTLNFAIDYEKIECVLSNLCKRGFCIVLTMKSLLNFKGYTDFKFDYIELEMIKHINEFINDIKLFHLIINKNDNRLDIWNWKTMEGKQLCLKMRNLKCLPKDCDEKQNFRMWDAYLKFDEWSQKDDIKINWNFF